MKHQMLDRLSQVAMCMVVALVPACTAMTVSYTHLGGIKGVLFGSIGGQCAKGQLITAADPAAAGLDGEFRQHFQVPDFIGAVLAHKVDAILFPGPVSYTHLYVYKRQVF